MRKITQNDVKAAVEAVIREVQEAGGHPMPELGPGLCPVGGLDGFDSLVSVEATVLLEQRLGVELPNDTMFIENGTASSVQEIVRRVAAACGVA
jgi:hypothetical protein